MSDPTNDVNDDVSGGDKAAEIAALEQRITAAFDQISGALSGLGNGNDTELAELTSALDDERGRNAQLEERLKLLNERQEGAMQELEERVIGFGQRSADQQRELAALRLICDKMRENNDLLRVSNAEGGGDLELINSGMQAEIEMLRAQLNADRTELDGILSELRPAITAAQSAEQSAGNSPESEAGAVPSPEPQEAV
ncbi:hypothetical protein [Halocynthiibacter namhaensis]|uniref:hypothetical protein n=1 Tax=Halocynthiibacter namhaensis TaxID=1290553 RepID=UPI00068F71A1|nr:hypothetical protein [Halocynthiibacter namhaensis]